ncbi:protein SODIUM POTASSIUM ROOT DEFECTIVE 3 [Elaeis guineensis]|uniref:Protein SODIUM POTASSIUM ROOT DEFECTIVE 3 n=1 Tax=Elaeis guineensis var. tenera TaxID=51953 RepID=A0A6I9RBN3_ELAGV|nr:protein SODIUM POTASSIUM ROOT DEFECTIVE 3 [Elaeis guineensis]
MAPSLFREIKRVSFSCASPTSAAVRTSIHRRSIDVPPGGKVGDDQTPHLHLRDSQRTTKSQSSSNTKSHSPKSGRKSSQKLADLLSPGDSSRYLLNSSRYVLNDSAFLDIFPGSEPVSAPLPAEPSMFRSKTRDELAVLRPSSSTRSHDQVVVLRVSLHCKGCEGKVRKHISKMEGVTSFSIDLATKKVTVVGDVTPLGVLNSISKVKNAQLWPSPPRSSASF